MAQTVEISLRIPSLRVRQEGKEDPQTISNGDVRFRKRVELETIPKPGTVLEMVAGSGPPFPCDVTRSDWHESKNCFVVACRYSRRSITPDEYQTLLNDPEWRADALV